MQNFTFIGKPIISTKKDKKDRPVFNPVYTKADSKWDTGKVKFSVKTGENNIAFVELGGGKPIGEALEKKHPITTFDSDFNKIEVDWKDRFDEKIVENVSFSRQYKTNITGKTEVFITEYDMRMFVSENLPNLASDTLIKVTGQMGTNEYNGNVSQTFNIQNIWLLDDESEEKPSAQIEIDLYYNTSGVEERDDEKVLDILAYYDDYFGKDDGTMKVPIKMSFNGTKLDMDNPKHKALWDSRVKLLEPDTDNFVKLRWVVKYINGAEEVEFNEEMLTDIQKTEIEMGVATLDDFKPSGTSFGNNKVEYRLVRPVLKKCGKLNYADGFIDTELDEDEFAMLVRRTEKTEESVDEMETVAEGKAELEVPETDEDDLF